METPIPDELDFLVQKALKESMHKKKEETIVKSISRVAASVAVFAVLFTAGINSSQTFAATLSKVPLIGSLVKVLTFREYVVNNDNFNADIKVPQIQGLKNKNLENSLNKKYLNENKKLYTEFMNEMKNMKKAGGGNLAVDSGYIVKTDTDRIFSIARYTVVVQASGAEKLKYDTIDKQNEILITLPSLFKNSSYIDIISENIKKQMIEQMKADEGKIYWVSGYTEGIPDDETFKKYLL